MTRAPYNTGKVKIGLAYERKNQHKPTPEENLVQNALLGLYDNNEDKYVKRFVGIVLFILLTLMVVSYAPR